jgi:hypothetical protein
MPDNRIRTGRQPDFAEDFDTQDDGFAGIEDAVRTKEPSARELFVAWEKLRVFITPSS